MLYKEKMDGLVSALEALDPKDGNCDVELLDLTEKVLMAARDEVNFIASHLKNPLAVHASMMTGTIATPSIENIIELYGAEALREALDAKNP